MINHKDVTFIIPVFSLKTHRINNLKFILPYILKTNCKVLVVEQIDGDKSSISEILKEFGGVEHLLFKTSEKRFHKTGIINWAVSNHVKTLYAWVNDVDYYMKFQSVLDADWSGAFIQPYSIAKKLSETDSIILLSGKSINVDYSDSAAQYISMYGALSFIFNVSEFVKNGGMDSSIYGWGQEDVEFSTRIKNKYEIQNLDIKGIHIWHPVENASLNSSKNRIAVVLVCHGKYLPYLEKCIGCIDSQSLPFDQKILALDGCEYTPPNDWVKVNTNKKNPNVARNAGFGQVFTEWVIFWDADNFMDREYHQKINSSIENSDKTVAFLYPDIKYVDLNGEILKKLKVPDYDYWLMREKTFVDTSSAWNVHALRTVGGWDVYSAGLDDYRLALHLTRNGWKGKKANAETSITLHPERRSQNNDTALKIWDVWSLGIVTLWSGLSPVNERLLEWYENADMPPDTSIYWVDNSGRDDVAKLLETFLKKLKNKVKSISITTIGKHYDVTADATYMSWNRHQHVANLYNYILPKICEDMVLFVEDDNIPPTDGIKKLYPHILPYKQTGAIGGVYRSRTSPRNACASQSVQKWLNPPVVDNMQKTNPLKVYMMGGGFTLYRNSALKKALPFCCTKLDSSGLMGWDANLGISLFKNKYDLYLHGEIFVEHHCKEVLAWEEMMKNEFGRDTKFTTDWFSQNIPHWKIKLSKFIGKKISALEIGSYEGRSAIWLVKNILTHDESTLICCDRFTAPDNGEAFFKNIELTNVSKKIRAVKGKTFDTLPKISGQFDLVYIDGGHTYEECMFEITTLWPLINRGATVIFDDYNHPEYSCGKAIDDFIAAHNSELRVTHRGHQLFMEKR